MPEDKVSGEPSTTDAAQDESTGSPGLSEHQSKLLLRMLRVAYPHPSFPDAPYERTAKAVQDAEPDRRGAAGGSGRPGRARRRRFLALDRRGGDRRCSSRSSTGAFFTLVHATTVVALYDDHEVWDLLGYEGASFDKGGYLHRGFDDLDWLPDPRIEEYDGPPRVEVVDGDATS